MSRALAVGRLHLVGWPRAVSWPWTILALSFTVNLVLFRAIGPEPGHLIITGGLSALYILMLVVHIQAITRLFPFAAALSVTRSAFYTGTCLVAVGQAVAYGAVLTGLLAIERGTDGWGGSMRFFGLPYLVAGDPVTQLAIYAGPLLAMSAIGLVCGSIYQRWQSTGMFLAFVGSVIGLGAIGWWITWIGSWPAVGRWLVDQPAVAVLGGWSTLLAVLIAAGGFLVIRRTPT